VYDPILGRWGEYTAQYAASNPHSTEEDMLESTKRKIDSETCVFISLTPNTEWYTYKEWYSGDSYEESKFFNLLFSTIPCSEPNASINIQAWR
jgi:hypothetical protein